MNKITKSVLVALATLTLVQSASAANYKGKCAKQAEDAAVKFWADVPNPDPNLEYMTFSSKETKPHSGVYVVILALSDGNEEAFAKYKVEFADADKCNEPKVSAAR